MFTIHRSRRAIPVVVTMLTCALSAPMAVTAQEQVLVEAQVPAAQDQVLIEEPPLVVADQPPALAPVAGSSWDETSGYGSVEASRAAIGHEEMVSGYSPTGHEASAAMGLSWDEMSGYGSVEASRMEIAGLVAPVPAPSWDQTSGYGAVEASRAMIGHPATSPTQVPADVRWAPQSPVAVRQATASDYIPAALSSGRRAESAHLATVPLPGDPVSATSDD